MGFCRIEEDKVKTVLPAFEFPEVESFNSIGPKALAAIQTCNAMRSVWLAATVAVNELIRRKSDVLRSSREIE